ncbi:hypothetical protein ACX93W_08150 [Paenibacillus sp. CAU 1782]
MGFHTAVLFISGFITFLMPNLESGKIHESNRSSKLSIAVIKSDVAMVARYYRNGVGRRYAGSGICDACIGTVRRTIRPARQRCRRGHFDGAVFNASIVKRFRLSTLISIGAIGNVAGYIIYAFSGSFAAAGIGFFVLAFFVSFANTGFATFYQNTIPVEAMGRIGGINGSSSAAYL